MVIIAQPKSYSDMLQRIFACTLGTGLICTIFVAIASPQVRVILDSIDTQLEIGPLKAVKALYVLVPLLVALVSRVVKLHDRISDWLGLRHRFDVKNILLPLTAAVGIALTEKMVGRIRANRRDLMYAVFYPYAGYDNPQIPKHLIYTALDKWGWFWVALEACVLTLATTVILVLVQCWLVAGVFGAVSAVLVAFMFVQWLSCVGSADAEVKEIARDSERAARIRSCFDALSREGSRH